MGYSSEYKMSDRGRNRTMKMISKYADRVSLLLSSAEVVDS